jgi:hypothetical protein
VPRQRGARHHDRLDNEEQQESRLAPLLLAGSIAAVYVAARIGLTYIAIGH